MHIHTWPIRVYLAPTEICREKVEGNRDERGRERKRVFACVCVCFLFHCLVWTAAELTVPRPLTSAPLSLITVHLKVPSLCCSFSTNAHHPPSNTPPLSFPFCSLIKSPFTSAFVYHQFHHFPPYTSHLHRFLILTPLHLLHPSLHLCHGSPSRCFHLQLHDISPTRVCVCVGQSWTLLCFGVIDRMRRRNQSWHAEVKMVLSSVFPPWGYGRKTNAVRWMGRALLHFLASSLASTCFVLKEVEGARPS